MRRARNVARVGDSAGLAGSFATGLGKLTRAPPGSARDERPVMAGRARERRDEECVGATSARTPPGEARPAAAPRGSRTGTGFVVWAVCGPPARTSIPHLLGVAVIGRDGEHAPRALDGAASTRPMQASSISTARTAALGHARVPDHVGVRVVEHHKVVRAVARGAAQAARSRPRALISGSDRRSRPWARGRAALLAGEWAPRGRR